MSETLNNQQEQPEKPSFRVRVFNRIVNDNLAEHSGKFGGNVPRMQEEARRILQKECEAYLQEIIMEANQLCGTKTLKEGFVLKAVEEREKQTGGWVWKDFDDADAIAESLTNGSNEVYVKEENETMETQKAFA